MAGSRAEQRSVAGLRILVVEDELLCAMELEALLDELQCEVIGPVSRVGDVIPLADKERDDGRGLHGALLDVNLRGERSYPAAVALQARRIPIVLITGYSSLPDCPAGLEQVPRVTKPFDRGQVEWAMLRAFADELADED